MLKSKWFFLLLILLVIFVGVWAVTIALGPDGVILAEGAEILGHVCGSTCSI